MANLLRFLSDTQVVPVLPVNDVVVLPHNALPICVGRSKSLQAVNKVTDESAREEYEDMIIVALQKAELRDDYPTMASELHPVAVLCKVQSVIPLSSGVCRVLVTGVHVVRIKKYIFDDDYISAKMSVIPEEDEDNVEVRHLSRLLLRESNSYIASQGKLPPELTASLQRYENESHKLVYSIASFLDISSCEKQKILETRDLKGKMSLTQEFLAREIQFNDFDQKIHQKMQDKIQKEQREFYLKQRITAIDELKSSNGAELNEIDDLMRKSESMKFSQETRDRFNSEIRKLRSMQAMSAEATVVRCYLEWLLDLPWRKFSESEIDIADAEGILNENHYGMEKLKERVVEYLAVQRRIKRPQGTRLCFVGPPGVGKTSFVESIAMAMGTKFVVVSMAGVRDEAEIRGHRRTYVGSMPGKIIASLKRAGVSNPVILLDEVDKIGSDNRGNPADALLEVLDPIQNSKFVDHYLEVEFDVSNVMFVCTANSINGIPLPLMDRMEIIHVSGYTENEKLEIAKRYIIPKQMKKNGLEKGEIKFSNAAILKMIRRYTRESGVRNLQREIEKISRKSIKSIMMNDKIDSISVTANNLMKYIGPEKCAYGIVDPKDRIGMVNGLAWSEAGGDLLNIEAVKIPGEGKIKYTGHLGDVMKESVQAAFSFACSRFDMLNIPKNSNKEYDIHVHVPEGAIPKDGPSAGVAMFTVIVSTMSNRPVRRDIAMTGEISLRGNVLPIGGLREKCLAALRGGIKLVIIPKDNKKDLAEMPQEVIKGLQIFPVDHADDVLRIALTAPIDDSLPLVNVSCVDENMISSNIN